MWLLWLCILSFELVINAVTIGSNSEISRNSFFTFPAVDTDNSVLGFASMDDGFALEDSTTTCTFDAIFPVRKQLFLNGGSLTLASDLRLDTMTSFTSFGHVRSIDDTPRRLILTQSIDTLGHAGLDAVTFENIELLLGGDMQLHSPIQFKGNCKIIGGGKTLEITDDGMLRVAPSSSLLLQNVILLNIDNDDLTCDDNTGEFVLDTMRIVQLNSANITFTTGSIKIQDRVSFSGTSTFFYDSKQTSTISANSEWLFTQGMFFSLARNAISGAQPLAFENNTSILHLDNAALQVGPTGLHLTKGKIRLDRNVIFSFLSTSTTTGVVLGTGIPADDFKLEFGPSAIVFSQFGHFTYNNAAPDCISSASKTAILYRTNNSNLYVAQNLTMSNITISLQSVATSPIVVNAGKILAFNDVRVLLPTLSLDITGRQPSPGVVLLPGSGLAFLNKGTMPLAVTVSSTGNTIAGQGTYNSPIIFLNSSAAATWSVIGGLNSSLTLNYGALTIDSGMQLGSSGSLVGPGRIVLNSQTVRTRNNSSTWSSPLLWQGSGKVELGNTVSLASTWTFSGGTCTIDGRGNVLNMGSGNIVVDSNTKLILKDITIADVSGSRMRCINDTASMVFDNVRWVQDGNFTFTHGSIQFQNKNIMRGEFVFAYQTIQTSTIIDYSTLKLDTAFTFSYDPSVDTGFDHEFEFIDETSELVLNGGSFIVTGLGASLKKGTMRVRLTSDIGSSASQDLYGYEVDGGITFGDGITSDNDLKLIIHPQVELNCVSGMIHYKNLDSAAVYMQHYLSALHMQSGSILHLIENFYTGLGRVIFDRGVGIARTGSADVVGTIEPRGSQR